MRPDRLLFVAALISSSASTQTALAQYAPPGAYPPPPAPQPPYGYAAQQQPMAGRAAQSSGFEISYLYGTAVAWGLGTGIWLDAELGIEDPGLRFIPPALFGAAAPGAVFVLDTQAFRPAMPAGLPSSIATGMLIGAGEALGIASYQHVATDKKNEWSFKGIARTEVIGSTLGAGAGYALYAFGNPSAQANLFLGSSIAWGTILGSEFGGGASSGKWGHANDATSLGGLIGFNVALASTAAVSSVWAPSFYQLEWMWGGLAIGTAASLPVYVFYAGSDHDARRGLIFQGVAGLIGLAAGGAYAYRPSAQVVAENALPPTWMRYIRTAGIVPMTGGAAANIAGQF